ncbi:hypothetical protein TNCV_3146701 [Trichonephila clavipes]|nr:hypothetical protein TNCV_3146701 [Trichonephila clavipes]
MDDNVRPHQANPVDEFLEIKTIKRIPWSTKYLQMVTFYKELGYVNPSVLYLVLESAWFCSLAGDGGRGNRWQEPMG